MSQPERRMRGRTRQFRTGRLPVQRTHLLPLMLLALLPCMVLGAGPTASSPQGIASAPQRAESWLLQGPPLHWAQAAAANEEHLLATTDAAPLRYKVRRRDARGEVLRQVVESREGTVARLLARDGQPLTTEENSAERERLQGILDDPSAFLRRSHHEDGSRAYAIELLHSMPASMLWSYTPGQPQLPNFPGRAVVLDFTPDPKYKPTSLVTDALTGVAGRVWVDPDTQFVLRIQGNILHPVDFGWGGVLARIREGGYVELEQRKAGNQRWLFSHMLERIAIREMLVHTVQENVEMNAFDVQAIAPVDFRDALHGLLNLPVATR